MKLVTAFAFFLLSGCKCGDRIAKKDKFIQLPTKDSALQNDVFVKKDRLIGIWTDGSTENATIDIQQDSIFYIDQLTSYKYSLKKDSISIVYTDWIFSGKVDFLNDTLILSDEEGVTKYWKFTR